MSALDQYTEAVAAAHREVAVAEALLKEHKDKLRMAEEELSDSHRRLSNAQRDLSNAVVEAHEAVHGKPVSIDDRFEFERRWDARIAEQKARHEAYEKDLIEDRTRRALANEKDVIEATRKALTNDTPIAG